MPPADIVAKATFATVGGLNHYFVATSDETKRVFQIGHQRTALTHVLPAINILTKTGIFLRLALSR